MSHLHKVGIYVTRNAWNKMERIIQVSRNSLGFIYQVSSCGCNGFNFQLSLLDGETYDKIKKKQTMVLQNNTMGVKLYVDPKSEMLLLDTKIDYVHEDYSKGQFESKFLFHVNPKLASSCGCGTSFSPKR